MKQKDIALIIVIAFISGVLSLFLSKLLITTPKNRSAQVTIVERITTDFPTPDQKYFNDKSFDPTSIIRVGDNSNPKPFNTKQ